MQFSKFATCLIIPGLFVAYAAAASALESQDERNLEQLSLGWMNAIEKKDQKTLEKLVADSFVLQKPGDETAQYTRRDEWIANAIKMDWSDFRYENMAVQVRGDQATVSSILHFRVSPFPFALDAGVVDTWERRGADWQVTRRHLGESNVQLRIAFIFGVIAAGLAVVVAYVIARLFRRYRR